MDPSILDKHLGQALNVRDVAEYLKLDCRTVRKYYQQLGGVRFGKAYRFFERRMNDAIQTKEREMAGAGQVTREDRQKITTNQTGSNQLGSRATKKAKAGQADPDPFKLTT
jgi:hypothetical protein